MTHTEADLRELLAERTAYGPGGEMDVAGIVRRGRRGKLIRWSTGAVLAGATAAAVIWALPGALPAPPPAPAAQPVVTATPSRTSMEAMFGLRDLPRSLDGRPRIGIYGYSGSASGDDLELKPKGHTVTVLVNCEDPQSWVVTAVKGGAGQVTRCQGGVARHAYDRGSLPSGWPDRHQSIRVWVFPPTELIGQASLDGCAVADKREGTCNGRYAAQELIRYDVALELAADLGIRPGAWIAGVYDGS